MTVLKKKSSLPKQTAKSSSRSKQNLMHIWRQRPTQDFCRIKLLSQKSKTCLFNCISNMTLKSKYKLPSKIIGKIWLDVVLQCDSPPPSWARPHRPATDFNFKSKYKNIHLDIDRNTNSNSNTNTNIKQMFVAMLHTLMLPNWLKKWGKIKCQIWWLWDQLLGLVLIRSGELQP